MGRSFGRLLTPSECFWKKGTHLSQTPEGTAMAQWKIFFQPKSLKLLVFSLYLLLPWIFFGLGVDVFHIPLAPGDGYVSGLPTKIFATTLSAWNPYILSGTYTYKDIGFQALYPPALLVMSLFPNPFGYNLLILIHYSFAGFFTYLFLKRMGLHVTAGFWGGLVYMFCGFLSAHFGHYMIVTTAMYLPVLLYCFESFFVTRRYLYLFFSALAFTGSLMSDYAAVSMYIGMVGFPYIVFRVFYGNEFHQSQLLKKIFWAICISFITFIGGVLLASVQVFPILESLSYVSRQKTNYEFFSSFSFPVQQIPMLIFPYLFGGFSPSFGYSFGYFGAWNLAELSGYMGILPLLLAILSVLLFIRHEKQILFWLLIAVGGFILVLGDSTPLYQLMYHIPGYNLFRAPARNWLEVNFSIAILSALFIHHNRVGGKFTPDAYFRAINALVGLFFLFIILTLTSWDKFFPELLNTKWKNSVLLTSPAVFIPLFFCIVSCIFLYVLHHYRQRNFFWNALIVFVFLDLFSFGHVFNANSYPNLSFFQNKPHAVFTYLNENNQDNFQYRILSLDFYGSEPELQPDLNMLYKISAANGYSNIWLSAYSRLTTFKADAVAGNTQELLINNSIISLLSTKYLITANDNDKLLLDTLGTTQNSYRKAHETSDGIAIYENMNFLPRARFVEQAQSIKHFRDAYSVIWENPHFNPKTTALMEGYRGDTIHPGRVISVDYSNNTNIKLTVETGVKSLLVLADSWYPGWKVYVDGKEDTLYKVYGIMRGVLIKGAGRHEVEFRFVPMSFYFGLAVTLVSTLFLFLTTFIHDKRKS